jgi:hypothetical protein
MTDNGAGTNQRGGRRPHVRPFVRNLDVLDTESKPTVHSVESTEISGGGGGTVFRVGS